MLWKLSNLAKLPFRATSRLLRTQFDKRFYISTYPEVINSGLDPIEHYCAKGWLEGFNPRPDFDTLYYRASNPDIAKAGINPFVHYLLHGREEGRLSQAPDERDRSLALDYFIIAPEFDVNYYLSEYPDVRNAKLDPIKHYVTSGWKEARRPRADFHTTYYYLKNKDVIPSGVNPFRHYIETGRQQGRSPCRQSGREPHLQLIHTPNLTTALDAVPSLRPLNENDYCLEVPFQIELGAPPVRRVAAIIHVYYTELFPKIVKYLKNVPFQTDLFISTDTAAKKSLILQSLKTYSNGTVEVMVFENRGRDIAPFIVGYAHVLNDYEYFIHLHTKRSPHGGDPLEGWLDYLLSNLLGSQQIVKSVFKLFLDCNVGIIYPQHLFVLRGILNWGYDFELAASLLSRAGFVLDKLRLLEFPSGSMFWGRSAALRPLLDLQLQFSDFPDEARQVDGTLAHAIERTILYFAELAGFRWAKILSDSADYPVRNAVLQTKNDDDILFNLALTYRPLLLKQLSGRTTTEKSIPETRSIIYYPSMNKRPRLNLLVPTINPSQSFGGVSTALNIFSDLEKLYESIADFRIVVTDAPTRWDASTRLNNYEYNALSVHDTNQRHEVVDAVERDDEPLTLRPSDIFVATAWWTAHLAFEAIDAQKRLFRKANKLVYLIQDFEPNFYGWSTKWVLAENTLRRGNETIAIINSIELCKFLMKDYKFAHCYYLPYKRNEEIHLKGKRDRQKIILFYGRPSVTRNLLELAADGISLWQQRNPTMAREWQIISAGEDYSKDVVSQVKNLKIVGKLTLEDYSSYLRTASVGISLMLSPHPSYPPLEMAEAGIVTITNSCFGKDLGRVANNIISLDRVTEDTIAEAIASAIRRANVAPELADGRKCELGPFVKCVPIYPKSGNVRERNGFFDSLFRQSKPDAPRPVSVYNAEELGRLLM
ncbi:MAG: rhamnan synthesis F family protein [Methylocella sp.]